MGAKSDTYAFQAGADYTDANRKYAMGVFVDYVGSTIDMPFDTDADSGTEGFGAYITYRPEKWHFDLFIRMSEGRYRVNIPHTPEIETNTGSASIAVTVGRHYALKSGITLVPEVQAAWTRTNVDTTKDSVPIDGTGENFYGREYRIKPIQSTSTRASLLVSKLLNIKKGYELRPYVRGAFSYEFDAETNMSVQTIAEPRPIKYKNDLGGAWGTINAGASLRIKDRFDVWTDVAWNFAGKTDGYNINLGAGYRF